jgi:alkanesulfonate monooxygenase SsuD/methylene tetrahydromethanopterin reductase-like flavin-dependent oxidoreductase (luciferase family)
VGVLPVPLRNVALTAMEMATLHRLFPSRVTLGVGHGVQTWMAQTGARVDSPITLITEYLTALRALLAGETAAERLETERLHWGYDSITDIAICGDATDFAEAIARWAEAGADTIVLQPTPDDPDPEGWVRFIAGEVRPLVP